MSEENEDREHTASADCWCNPKVEYVPPVNVNPVIWRTVKCPTCHAVAGLACEDADGYRQPRQTHPARTELFYDLTEYRG